MELVDSGGPGSGKRTGAMLAAARTAAGLELTDVARETRVPLRHLKALEADRHEDLPALPYAIGFVKAFARSVGLDSETVAAHFRSETSKSPHVPAPLTLEPLDERRVPSRALWMTSLAIVIAVIAALSAWGSGAFDPAPPAAPALAANTGVAPAESAAPLAAPADGIVDPAAVSPPAAALPVVAAAGVAGAPVVLTAKEEVWVKIYDNATRTTAKIGVLQPGESYAVPANPPGLLLWTGKAGALAVTVGGKPIPPLGGPVDTVRGLSLAAADLVARSQPAGAAAAPAGPKPIATIPGA
ncbi:helix-turn-helix domain-containing protein [Sandarakinorhabdus sp. DWP1-3-1]|uniref:helix-turn-helix domain-containing protein n=1 Tax=Sandarakinorhabdus sp. DWP1-3-1 TaxID=2804627 RepID=UPI003CF7C8BC